MYVLKKHGLLRAFTTKLVLFKYYAERCEMSMAIQVIQGSSSLEHPVPSFDSLSTQPSNNKSCQEFPAQEWHLARHCPRGDWELSFWSLDHFWVEEYGASSPGSLHSSPQLFLSNIKEVVRQMEELHGLESTCKLSVGPDSIKSLGC